MFGLEQPSHWLVIIVIAALLFGYKKLPDMARSAGRSMRLFKTEIKGMADDDEARREHDDKKPQADAGSAQAAANQAQAAANEAQAQANRAQQPPAALPPAAAADNAPHPSGAAQPAQPQQQTTVSRSSDPASPTYE